MQSQTELKIATATLHYQAQLGTSPTTFSDLIMAKYLEKRDIANFYSPRYEDDQEERQK